MTKLLDTTILKDIDAVIFDVDGTLVDSMWVWEAVDEEYFQRYHLRQPENFHAIIEGMSYREVAEYYLSTFPEINCSVEELMDEWTQMASDKYRYEVELKQGVREFITNVRIMGKKIGIATSNQKEMVEGMIEERKMRALFDVIHSACEVGAGKPSPDVYLLVAKDLGVSPERCLVFEDIPNGILAGKNANMKVCAVEDRFSKPQEKLKRNLADYYIQTFHDIENETYEVL